MADLGFDGKVAIITGAGGGLGRSHALELARRGALVVVNDLGGSVDGTGSGTTAAQAVVDEITAAGGEAVANYDSVATPEGGQAIVQTALDALGRVDIIINNAGILRDASFKNMDADKVDPVLDVHLRGAFNVTQPAWEHMRDQGYGRIVNTRSGAGIFGNFGQTNYGAAKMGLVGLTRVLAVEGAKYNIKANAIAPVAKTRMTEDILGPWPTSSSRRWSRRWWPSWPTRTARCPARSTRWAAAGWPGCSWASPGASPTRPSRPRPCATASTRSGTRRATRCRRTSTRS